MFPHFCPLSPHSPWCVFLNVSYISPGNAWRGGLHHERQPTAPEEEQEEVETAVVPPQRQGALHLHSLWGEGAQSLPHQPQKHSHTLSVLTYAIPHKPCLFFLFTGANILTHFNLSSWTKHCQWLMKGFSVLSLCCAAFFFLRHEILR